MYIIGAAVADEHAQVALYDKEYKLLNKKEGKAEDLSKLCLEIAPEMKDVEYIGVAAKDFGAVAAELEKATGVKCFGESVISARALGEAYITNDVPFVAMLKIDDSVECGIVMDKKVFSGANQEGVNAARMIIKFDGYECKCGTKGCFEAYASVSGLKRIASESGVADADSLTHEKLFAMNTPEAEKAKTLYVEYLASGITDIINLFQPNELVLEGPFTEVGDALWNPLMAIILHDQYTHSMPNKCNVRFSNKEIDTALLGAALLGR